MIILGSTGSIGVNTLFVAKKYNLSIDLLFCGFNADLITIQAQEFNPRVVIVADRQTALKVRFKNVKYGMEALLEEIFKSKSSLVVNALVGFLGLMPTIESIKLGKKVALANKESLVVAGKFLDMSKIIPIDSEHFALKYIYNSDKKIKKMYITASGGALRDYPLKDFDNVSIKDVLAHPNWKMGNKITVDSATMCNKIFELIEAKWLFDINSLDALIEPSSTMHAMIEYNDGSIVTHLANADMRLPIAYAILGKVDDLLLPRIDLLGLKKLSLLEIDTNRYPFWKLKDLLLNNLDLGVVLNASNEKAVELFLDKKIKFTTINKLVVQALDKFNDIKISSLEDIFKIDKEVRGYTQNI